MERIRFTKRALLSLGLPSAGERTTIYDTEIPKLALRITSSGSKSFYVVKRTGSTMTWIKLGGFPDMTVEQARNSATQVLAEFAAGADPAEARRAIKGEPTFEEIFQRYLKEKRKRDGSHLTPKTKTNYEDVKKFYLKKIANKKISTITREDLKSIHKLTSSKSFFQADRAIRIVSAVFNFAIEIGLFSGSNPASKIQKNPSIERDRFVQASELPYLFDAISKSPIADFFFLALLTGARRSNIQEMAWHDIDIPSGIWRIGITKNGTPQNVTLSPEAIEILNTRKRHANTSQFVFPGPGKTGHIVEPKTSWSTIKSRATSNRIISLLREAGHLDKDELLEAEELISSSPRKAELRYRKIAEKLNISRAAYNMSDLRLHDLRRTLGSWQAKTGASLPIIGKSLNHLTTQATRIYARLDLDPVRQSVNTATQAIFEAAKFAIDGSDTPKKQENIQKNAQ